MADLREHVIDQVRRNYCGEVAADVTMRKIGGWLYEGLAEAIKHEVLTEAEVLDMDSLVGLVLLLQAAADEMREMLPPELQRLADEEQPLVDPDGLVDRMLRVLT